jgi:hypothetical protein
LLDRVVENAWTYVATVDFFVGVFGHLLFEQLVGRVFPYHGRHDECVRVVVLMMSKLSLSRWR